MTFDSLPVNHISIPFPSDPDKYTFNILAGNQTYDVVNYDGDTGDSYYQKFVLGSNNNDIMQFVPDALQYNNSLVGFGFMSIIMENGDLYLKNVNNGKQVFVKSGFFDISTIEPIYDFHPVVGSDFYRFQLYRERGPKNIIYEVHSETMELKVAFVFNVPFVDIGHSIMTDKKDEYYFVFWLNQTTNIGIAKRGYDKTFYCATKLPASSYNMIIFYNDQWIVSHVNTKLVIYNRQMNKYHHYAFQTMWECITFDKSREALKLLFVDFKNGTSTESLIMLRLSDTIQQNWPYLTREKKYYLKFVHWLLNKQLNLPKEITKVIMKDILELPEKQQ